MDKKGWKQEVTIEADVTNDVKECMKRTAHSTQVKRTIRREETHCTLLSEPFAQPGVATGTPRSRSAWGNVSWQLFTRYLGCTPRPVPALGKIAAPDCPGPENFQDCPAPLPLLTPRMPELNCYPAPTWGFYPCPAPKFFVWQFQISLNLPKGMEKVSRKVILVTYIHTDNSQYELW